MTTPAVPRFSESRIRCSRRSFAASASLALLIAVAGCRHSSTLSAAKCREHVALLSRAATEDLREIRSGLPRGAELLRDYFAAGKFEDATAARDALDRVRNKVQDLRTAKATFFALVDTNGVVLRSDRAPDLLAGKSLLSAFPDLKQGFGGTFVETRGQMDEAAGVRGKPDAQWVAAAPIRVDAAVKGLYAAGWSWSAYAYRLENQLRSSIRSGLDKGGKEPLVYVYVVVGKAVFGAPLSPVVNAEVVAAQNFMAVPAADAVTREVEITEREFGIGFVRTPELGKDVGIAVVRSET